MLMRIFSLSVFTPRKWLRGFLFVTNQGHHGMQLTLIKNPDENLGAAYKIARAVYAETNASSLPVVEALTSMIQNAARAYGCACADIVRDKENFHAPVPDVAASNRGFQMCVRVAQRMLNGSLPDCCRGATRFHHADVMPGWATSRGYIADVDGLLFYL